MRTPTPIDAQLAWHSNALANGRRAWNGKGGDEHPEVGWFTKHGRPMTAARIWLESETDPDTGELIADEFLRCEVNGRERDPEKEWPYLCGNPISEAEFHYLMAAQGWAERYEPADPAAEPHKPVNWLQSPPRF